MMEVRFRGYEGDQGQKGSVLVRTKGDRSKGSGTVELLRWIEPAADGILELRRLEGVDKRPSNILLAPGVVSSGGGV